MAVTLTSPVLGQPVGATVTDAAIEPWLLAEGYAKQDAYTGPGVSNTGVTGVDPEDDPTVAENRGDKPWRPGDPVVWTMANDADNLNEDEFPHVAYDFDPGGTDNDAPANVILMMNTGAVGGGDTVPIVGDNLEGVTSVTFGGDAGTDLTEVLDGDRKVASLTVVTPAHAAGVVDVVLIDPSGNTTLAASFTYA